MELDRQGGSTIGMGWRVGMAGLLALGVWFRLYGSLAEPFWLDEAYSAYAAGKGWWFLWHVVPRYETHPPFYYSLLRAWTLLFGDSVAGQRSLGYACGVATLPLVGALGRDVARACGLNPQRIAWGAVAFAALSVVLVAMTREVRPYPVMILVYGATIWALVRVQAVVRRDGRIGAPSYLAYLAGLALMLWLHNLGALYAAALGTALLIVVGRRGMPARDWGWLVAGHGAVALLWLPAVLILADQAPTWVTKTWLTFAWRDVPGKLALLYAAPGLPGAAGLIVLAGLAGWRTVASPDAARRIGAALFVLALLPPLIAIGVSALVAPVFIVRTMTATAVPATILLAIGVLGWPDGRRRWLGLGAGLVVLTQTTIIDIRERQHLGGQQDWYGVVRFLAPRWRPGDVLLAYPNEGALPLMFALRDLHVPIVVRPVPTAVPAIGVAGWYPTGSRGVVSLPRDRLRAIAQLPVIKAAPTIWLMRLGPRTYDRGGMFLQELARGRRPVARLYWNPIDLIALRRVAPVLTARRAAPAGAGAAR